MDELYIGKKDTCIEKFIQSSAELSLLGKGDGAEVMIQKIKQDTTFFIEPGDESDVLEFFFILDGVIELEKKKEKIRLTSGDYIYAHHLKDHVQLYTVTDTKLLYFSSQPVFHYLSNSIKELVKIANDVELKDTYTHGHIQRVGDYALKIAKKMNLSNEQIENIGFASLFHDVGKINVPDEILKKTDRLTFEEFEVIKNHSSWGAEIVSTTYYEKLSDIIKQHHERLDGSGYPDKLKDDEILLEAKIIAVADSYDAMTSDRSYRKAFTPKFAIEELLSLVDAHYDKKVVEILYDILKEEGELET